MENVFQVLPQNFNIYISLPILFIFRLGVRSVEMMKERKVNFTFRCAVIYLQALLMLP